MTICIDLGYSQNFLLILIKMFPGKRSERAAKLGNFTKAQWCVGLGIELKSERSPV